MNKEERREKFVREYSGIHPSLVWSETDKKMFLSIERQKIKKIARLKRHLRIEQARNIEEKTLQEIGDEFGVSRQRIEQILKVISKTKMVDDDKQMGSY